MDIHSCKYENLLIAVIEKEQPDMFLLGEDRYKANKDYFEDME